MTQEYYLTCKTCGWEEWVEEPLWLRKAVDHMDASVWKHNRTINIGSTVWEWGGTMGSTIIRNFRNLLVG